MGKRLEPLHTLSIPFVAAVHLLEVSSIPDDEIMSPVRDLFLDITSSKIDAEELPRTVKL